MADEAKLQQANFVYTVEVLAFQISEPLDNGFRMFSGKIARKDRVFSKVEVGLLYTLTHNGREWRVHFVSSNDSGHYFYGTTE